MTEFTPPFLVFEDLDLSTYESLESMVAGLEGVDVEDGVYEAFDSVGRVVPLVSLGVRRGRFSVDIGETRVDLTVHDAIDKRRLQDRLQARLRATGRDMPHDSELRALIARALTGE